MKKLQNINKYFPSLLLIIVIIIIWQVCSINGFIPDYMLPSPNGIISAFIKDLDLLLGHAKVTLLEAIIGLSLGMLFSFIISLVMDNSRLLYRILYPYIIVSQTIPTIAIAPLLVLWLGYGILPKVTLIVLTVFFPITISLLNGYKAIDQDALQLMKTMGANKYQIFLHLKFPAALPSLFSGLQIAVTYSVIGAVVAEWLGGFEGLGVYMTRVRKAYAFDKMFAIIFFISIISIVLMLVIIWLRKKCMPWTDLEMKERKK